MSEESVGRDMQLECRVLLVEDSPVISIEIEEVLQNAGCEEITAVGTLHGAFSAFEKKTFDAAILDINLGDDLVFSFARKLRASGVPFLFLTAYHPETILPEEFAGTIYLNKPVPDELLLGELEALLRGENS